MSPSWIITSYPTRANGIIVLVNSQTGFCRRFLFPQFYKASGKSILKHYLANQKVRNAIVGAENLLITNIRRTNLPHRLFSSLFPRVVEKEGTLRSTTATSTKTSPQNRTSL